MILSAEIALASSQAVRRIDATSSGQDRSAPRYGTAAALPAPRGARARRARVRPPAPRGPPSVSRGLSQSGALSGPSQTTGLLLTPRGGREVHHEDRADRRNGPGRVHARGRTDRARSPRDCPPPHLGVSASPLAGALEDASVVVDVSSSPSIADAASLEFFQTSTRDIVAAAAGAAVGHLVAVSVVGTDRLPESRYCRAKLLREKLLMASSLPYSIVRTMPLVLSSPVNGIVEVAGPRPVRPPQAGRTERPARGGRQRERPLLRRRARRANAPPRRWPSRLRDALRGRVQRIRARKSSRPRRALASAPLTKGARMTRTTMMQTTSGDWIHPWDLVRRRWASPTRPVPGEGAVVLETPLRGVAGQSAGVRQQTAT